MVLTISLTNTTLPNMKFCPCSSTIFPRHHRMGPEHNSKKNHKTPTLPNLRSLPQLTRLLTHVSLPPAEYHSAGASARIGSLHSGYQRGVRVHYRAAGGTVPLDQAPLPEQAAHGGGEQDRPCNPGGASGFRRCPLEGDGRGSCTRIQRWWVFAQA